MGFLCCQLMRRTNQNYLHLQQSHWICIGRLSKKIPRTYKKGCRTTHTNTLEMRAKHARNSYKCITRLIVTGARQVGHGPVETLCTARTVRAQRAKRPRVDPSADGGQAMIGGRALCGSAHRPLRQFSGNQGRGDLGAVCDAARFKTLPPSPGVCAHACTTPTPGCPPRSHRKTVTTLSFFAAPPPPLEKNPETVPRPLAFA